MSNETTVNVYVIVNGKPEKVYNGSVKSKSAPSGNQSSKEEKVKIRDYAIKSLKRGVTCETLAEELGISVHSVRGYKALIKMGW